jgi:hypothetical protein
MHGVRANECASGGKSAHLVMPREATSATQQVCPTGAYRTECDLVALPAAT